MFTGIVEALGRVESLAPSAHGGHRLSVRVPEARDWRLALGESCAISGVCLTVVAAESGRLAFDLADETRRVTTLGHLREGDPVNLERPLRLDARLGGHLVLGHVDGVGHVFERRSEGEGAWLGVTVPAALRALLVPKGSVAVDGVSLTVAAIQADGFGVALIPHTLTVTTLGARRSGDQVNLETDVIGKYVRGFLAPWEPVRREP